MSISPQRSGPTAPSSNECAPLLVVEDIRIAYPGRRGLLHSTPPTEVIKGVSFEVGVGETVGLVGESGSGKSTIGKAVLGMLPVTSGSITFDGKPMPRDRQAQKWHRRNVQAVFQDPLSSLNPTMTIGETIAEPIRRLSGVDDGQEINARVDHLLDAVGMSARQARCYPSELSGGQRQRVAIARALAPQPRLIVADEAVSALDVSTQAQIVNLFADLQEEMGVAYLFIAHDLGVVRHLSSRTAVLYQGDLVEWGDACAVHDRPEHPYTQSLVAAAPIPDPARQRARREARLAARR